MVFEMCLNDLDDALQRATTTGIERVAGLCFIGLTSYFEAFCKDHAASIVNIAPALIENLRRAGYDTRVDAQRALEFGARYPNKVGALVMESYDFGTGKRINAIFQTLIGITPFSKRDLNRYDEILRDRNLLVHHAGTYTAKYLEQVGSWRERITDAYVNSLVVTPKALKMAIAFLERIARKLCDASYNAMTEHFNTSPGSLEPERRQALDYLLGQLGTRTAELPE
jgi:hypothetical protein